MQKDKITIVHNHLLARLPGHKNIIYSSVCKAIPAASRACTFQKGPKAICFPFSIIGLVLVITIVHKGEGQKQRLKGKKLICRYEQKICFPSFNH